MPDIGKIIGLLALGRGMSEHSRIRHFLGGIARVVVFAIITAMLAGALLIGLLYGGYALLTGNGLSPGVALSSIAAVTVLFIAIFGLLTVQAMQRAIAVPHVPESDGDGLVGHATAILDAFVDGLLTHPVQVESPDSEVPPRSASAAA